jgi:hypothetical protein
MDEAQDDAKTATVSSVMVRKNILLEYILVTPLQSCSSKASVD